MAERIWSKLFVSHFHLGVIPVHLPIVLQAIFHTFSHENRFLVAGLKVKKLPDWSARQAAYMTSVKDFLTKLKPEFSNLPVTFVRAIRYEPKLLLSVECPKAKQ
jgi:hypothetical protein